MSGEDRFDEDPLVGAGGFEPPEDPLGAPPEEQPQVERSRVQRQFVSNIPIGRTEFPDWEFITKVVELLEPYAAAPGDIAPWPPLRIRGRDRRGSYDALDLDAFREERDGRGEELENITIDVTGKDERGLTSYTVYYRPDAGSGDFRAATK